MSEPPIAIRGRFLPGNNANPHGRPTKAERIAQIHAKMAELAARFGGLEALDSIEYERIHLAATLILRGSRTAEDHVRLINSADRLLARVEKSCRGKPNQTENRSEPQQRAGLSGLTDRSRASVAPADDRAPRRSGKGFHKHYSSSF